MAATIWRLAAWHSEIRRPVQVAAKGSFASCSQNSQSRQWFQTTPVNQRAWSHSCAPSSFVPSSALSGTIDGNRFGAWWFWYCHRPSCERRRRRKQFNPTATNEVRLREMMCVPSRFNYSAPARRISMLPRDDPFPKCVVDQYTIEKCLFLFGG